MIPLSITETSSVVEEANINNGRNQTTKSKRLSEINLDRSTDSLFNLQHLNQRNSLQLEEEI